MRWTEAAAALLVLECCAAAQTAPMPSIPAPPPPPVQAVFTVVLDAAHGGSDSGAILRGDLPEKKITLEVVEQLEAALRGRRIDAVATRTTDENLPPENRADTANHAQAAACLVIHATATGSGVHLYTSALSPAPMGQLLSWQTAQAAYVTKSLKLEAEIDSALAHAEIPVTLGRASVQPMDSLACATVAVELAPLVGGHVTGARDITDATYQKSVVDALAAGLGSWQNDWKQ
jgi:N-acetylmuramoyl-L-alanine amidase